jgi:hypothetical protein
VPAEPSLTAELAALAEASSDALSRLRAGDESALVGMLETRERLLQALEAATVEDHDPALLDAASRAVALDGQIVAALEEQRSAVAQQLEKLVSHRQSLAGYGAHRDSGGAFVERLT